jgi:2-polyprenyl-6-methoxyphenol hydroxylase-like FAD-dependent oxidoreductase
MNADAEQFDVVIVGARCAGSPLATMLAQRGVQVCLLDRSRFPSDSLSTHVIQPCGVQVLERLGVLDQALAAGAVPVTRFTLLDEDVKIDADIDPESFGAPALCLRRLKLDHLLVEAAAAAGAEVRAATGVTDLLWDEGRVAGVETQSGALRASLVVGADGRSSTVARLVGASEYRVEPPGRLFSWAYFEGVGEDEGRLRLGHLGEIAYLCCPTDSTLFMAGVCPPMAARDAFLADREGGFTAGIEGWPELAGLLAGARRVGPIRVLADWHGYLREAAGPGWVLFGDAGHFKDPTAAQGISDALRQAERLTDAIVAGLPGGARLDGELRRWWRWRDEDAHEMFGFATDIGNGASPLLSGELLGEIAIEGGAPEQLLRVLNRDLLPSQLFTHSRIDRAIGRIVRDHPRKVPALLREVALELRNQVRRSWQLHRPPAPSRNRVPGTAFATEPLLLALSTLGFVLPFALFGLFITENGFDPSGYFALWTNDVPSTQLLLDLAVAALAFFVWAAVEGPRAQIRRWWLCIPATLLVGLCFGLPLFLLMRERALRRAALPQT